MTTITAEDSRALLEPLTECTPGPWCMVASDNYEIHSDATPEAYPHRFPSDDLGRFVALVGNRSEHHGEWDARLIAASPDLVDHLRAALDREAAALARTERAEFETQVGDDIIRQLGEALQATEAERDAAQAEAQEQARLNGRGAERELALMARLDEAQTEVGRLRAALERMIQAVCGETGFAAAVRLNSGLEYPWPALEIAEAASRAALAAGKETP